jgi:hypothetical protein
VCVCVFSSRVGRRGALSANLLTLGGHPGSYMGLFTKVQSVSLEGFHGQALIAQYVEECHVYVVDLP